MAGKDLGNHLFLAQVRSLGTHELMPDFVIYEQGEKTLGAFASMDNGAMKFSSLRIPRSQMLSKFAPLGRDGRYRSSPNKSHSYTSMVIIRGLMSQEIG